VFIRAGFGTVTAAWATSDFRRGMVEKGGHLVADAEKAKATSRVPGPIEQVEDQTR
jgi:hypothetical protein